MQLQRVTSFWKLKYQYGLKRDVGLHSRRLSQMERCVPGAGTEGKILARLIIFLRFKQPIYDYKTSPIADVFDLIVSFSYQWSPIDLLLHYYTRI